MDTQSYDGQGSAAPTSIIKMIWGSYGKALIGSCAVVMVGLVILFVSILSVTDPARAAEPTANPVPTQIATDSGSIAIHVDKVEYPLPYPGLLPDSPLYRIKAMRDRITLMFTGDQIKKAEKELLFADKRINAAVTLVDGGKEDLGVSTATKAEKYLEQAANRVIEQQKAGKDVKSLLLTLRDSATKHTELLDGLQAKVNGDHKTTLGKTGKTTQMVLEHVEQAIRE